MSYRVLIWRHTEPGIKPYWVVWVTLTEGNDTRYRRIGMSTYGLAKKETTLISYLAKGSNGNFVEFDRMLSGARYRRPSPDELHEYYRKQKNYALKSLRKRLIDVQS